VAGAVALLGVACGSAGSDSPTAARSATSLIGTNRVGGAADSSGDPTPKALAWSACGGEFECATLAVPLDWADPGGASIDLAVIRQPATDADHRIGSLVVNPGGPGASGVDHVRGRSESHAGLNQRFDIVSWDPRGTGASAPLSCAGGANAFLSLDPSPDTVAEQTSLDDAARGVADDCGRHAGPLLDHLDTASTVRDLEQLRRALGDDQLNFLGYSYGTAIGLAYAERYPDHLRALVLDGVDQPDWDLTDLLAAQANGFEHAVTVMLRRCDGVVDAACPLQSASATYDRVAAALETAPIPDGSGGAFGPAELATAATTAAYAPDRADTFLHGLAAADRGDGSGLMPLVELYRGQSQSYAAYAGVSCVDSPHPEGAGAYRAFADRLTAQYPRFGASVANEMLPCAFWPSPVTRSPHVVSAPGTPPILVVGTTGDPATPYSSAVSVARELAQGVLVTVDGAGHTSGGQSTCLTDTVGRYFTDLVVPTANSLCPVDHS